MPESQPRSDLEVQVSYQAADLLSDPVVEETIVSEVPTEVVQSLEPSSGKDLIQSGHEILEANSKFQSLVPASEEIDSTDTDLGNLQLRQQPEPLRKRQILTDTTTPSTKPLAVPTPIQAPNAPGTNNVPVGSDPEKSIADPDLGDLPVVPFDEDFGRLPTKPVDQVLPPPPRPKWLYLSGRLDYFNSGNAFAATDRLQDSLIRTGFTLSAIPKLGPKTFFLGAIDGNIVRYGTYGKSPDSLNYDELRLRAGILQQLSPRMYGEIGWTNQKLFTAQDGLRNILSGDRFLNENSLRLELSRTDPLTPRLSLGTYYQLRWSTSNRSENDRLTNTAFAALTYKLSPSWNAGVDYFFSWSHYTNVDRSDVYQQVQARTGYAINRNLQMSLFGGFSFGGSTDDRRVFGRSPGPGLNPNSQLQYDGWFFGVNLTVSTPLL